ncbi:MAG: S9 family peptidase [Planctomycetia bacterium]|nr:S9 family peptidase [Planctomycetia bacterium]
MKPPRFLFIIAVVVAPFVEAASQAADTLTDRFQPMDVFQLEHASDPQVSPDGKQIVYVRNFMDIKKDRRRSHLWIINADGTEHRPVTNGDANDHTPRWSPDGKQLLFVSGTAGDGPPQLHRRWMDTGQTARLGQLPAAPSELAWAPNGKSIAFVMQVVERPEPLVKLPKPDGAEWAEPFKEIRTLNYRHDGKGYLKEGYHHVFVLPADGGTPRQLMKGAHEHRGPLAWTPDGKALLVTANRNPEGAHDPLNTEIYEVAVADGALKALTKRQGPDGHPALSPDGKQVAYLGFDDKRQGYQVTRLYLMNRDGSGSKLSTGQFDRDVRSPIWSRDGKRVYFQFDDQGDTKIGFIDPLSSKVETVADHIGGTTLDRPYASGSFSVAGDGTVAFTLTSPERPADVAVRRPGDKEARRLTRLNDSLLGQKALGTVEEIRYKSSHDGRQIHGWIVKPPNFDPKKQYPLILEIHGGPFANYGPRFAADMQLYAAAGYVVFYANPRGSTSYGEEFGNLIHHAYPGHDYDDLMSGVDAVLKLGYVDDKNLFVTGGSGGGVLSAWIIGKTNRFRAAVVCKPVINWYSFVLTADVYPFFARYWFPGPPWEHAEHYLKRSPLALVGNVQTPTMLITGEADHRTPMSESEQYYQALKLRKIETVLVRVPGAPHDIAQRPSHMAMKAAYVLRWFEMHGQAR